MSIVSHFEKATRDSTISYFFLMLGYKLFSLYFPLFLLEKGLSLSKIGFIYLLIYLPIVIFSPLAGEASRKIRPSFLVIVGISGYTLYSLGLLALPLSIFFYALQVILGISAAFFFVGNRVILMSSHLNRPASSFGWFYSAPYYASGMAPVIGAAIIFLWGFREVFLASILIYLINIVFTFFFMRKNVEKRTASFIPEAPIGHFKQVVKKAFQSDVRPILIFSLIIITLGGFYQSFFLIFLENIGWQRAQILLYSSLFSILFLPLSLFGIKYLARANIVKVIILGGAIAAICSIVIGLTALALGFIGILIFMLIGDLGRFLSSSSRSGFIVKNFSSFPHGAAVLDTIFAPLGIALGSLLGGLLISPIGYSGIFVLGGIVILILAFILNFRPLTVENKV